MAVAGRTTAIRSRMPGRLESDQQLRQDAGADVLYHPRAL
jgi:hypothetical protein